jgi:hypothetical protein
VTLCDGETEVRSSPYDIEVRSLSLTHSTVILAVVILVDILAGFSRARPRLVFLL